jgi:hypothetical protein
MTKCLEARRPGVGVVSLIVALSDVLFAHSAAAEVAIVNSDTWELYGRGQVDGFMSYGWGDANPIPSNPVGTLSPPATLNIAIDGMPRYGPDGKTNIQGTFESMRLRSGYIPNVFGMGLRRRVNDDVTLNVYVALWSTIESDGQAKTNHIKTDAREGYVRVDGPWGMLLVGRAEDLFSRGASENELLYGHPYGLGFPGTIESSGPATGLINFGVMAAFFSPGFVYETPNLRGLKLAVGLYDPSPLEEIYDATHSARPETELTYDIHARSFKMHVFADGAYQKVYRAGGNDSHTSWGIGYGGRVEVGPVHVGIEGYYGPGLGLGYALEPGSISVTPNFGLRTFDGYSALLQYSARAFDLNFGIGMSRTFELQEDINANVSVISRELGYSAGIVYHFTDYLHYDIDALRGDSRWYFGEKQIFTFVNTGLTAEW